METDTKESTQMGGFMERASTRGPMGLAIRESSFRECERDRVHGNQPLLKLTHTVANTKRIRKMGWVGTYGPMDAFTKDNSSMMSSTLFYMQAWPWPHNIP